MIMRGPGRIAPPGIFHECDRLLPSFLNHAPEACDGRMSRQELSPALDLADGILVLPEQINVLASLLLGNDKRGIAAPEYG